MSNFKIQIINHSSQLQLKTSIIPEPALITFQTGSQSLLNYPLDQLIEIVASHFQGQSGDKLTVIKTLKILSNSLNDSKLVKKLQVVLENGAKTEQKLYQLLKIWASLTCNLPSILLKFTEKTRKQIILVIFGHFLLFKQSGEEGLLRQLSGLIQLVHKKQELMAYLKKIYLQNKEPLKLCIKKCMKIRTQHIQLRQFIKQWSEYCVGTSQKRVLQIISEQESRRQLCYLIQRMPNLNTIFTKQLKSLITQQNFIKYITETSEIGTFYKLTAKEWLNQANNYWKIVDKYLNPKDDLFKVDVINLGKNINRQTLQNQCLTVKYLYNYLQGLPFSFEREDKILFNNQKQPWTDIYRSISLCTSYQMMNLIVINITSAPKWWPCTDPFKIKIQNKNIAKLISKYKDFIQSKTKHMGINNKKLELVYSTFIVRDKQSNVESILSLQQLIQCIEGNKPLSINYKYRQNYPPFKEQVLKINEQPKKQHNIIIEAKIVKLLKRHKQAISLISISKESNYSLQTVQLAIKRLISKGIAQQTSSGYLYQA